MYELKGYHLPQRRHTTHEQGWVGGIGYRKGYCKGEHWGTYSTRNHDEPTADNAYGYHYDNVMVLLETLEDFCRTTFPLVYEEREQFIQLYELDSITDVSTSFLSSFLLHLFYPQALTSLLLFQVSPHAIFSHNFRGVPHFDYDVGYAMGIWLLHHSSGCPYNDERCAPHWYFYLPQHHLAVKLKHGTVIVWNSAEVAHCTIHDQVFPGCKVTALCMVTQIQKTYARVVWRIKHGEKLVF